MKFLVVDDDPVALGVIETTLSQAGYTDITAASSATEAFREITMASTPFECILLDIRMPGVDGLEACRALRKLPTYISTPIIMITAMRDKRLIEDAFQSGADDYITKPFDHVEMVNRVRIAERALRGRAELQQTRQSLAALSAKYEEMCQFPREAPIILPDVPGLVEHAVMENFLLQMSREQSYSCDAVAVHLSGFSDLHRALSASELVELLRDVATALSARIDAEKYLISYYGSGRFVVVTGRDQAALSTKAFTQLAQDIAAMPRSAALARAGLSISLTRGKPARHMLFFNGDPTAIIEKALGSAASYA